MEGIVQTFTSLVFINFIQKDLPSPLFVRSKLDCAKGCVLDHYCQSFFYVNSVNRKLCYHIPELLTNTMGLIAQDNVGYHLVQKVTCPQAIGYTCNTAINVCYKIHVNGSHTWSEARHTCQEEGGDLITLENSAKDEFIKKAIFDIIGTKNVDFFIGGKQTSTLGSWEWIDGTSINGFTKNSGEKLCLEIDMNMWDDDKCDSIRQPFVCEIKLT